MGLVLLMVTGASSLVEELEVWRGRRIEVVLISDEGRLRRGTRVGRVRVGDWVVFGVGGVIRFEGSCLGGIGVGVVVAVEEEEMLEEERMWGSLELAMVREIGGAGGGGRREGDGEGIWDGAGLGGRRVEGGGRCWGLNNGIYQHFLLGINCIFQWKD
ncbi:hypothetical protein CDL15_Pgr018479 [Punica granatum]|nr:hypothetical protein CDL15_Pgr018479 [Punica granatum]